jgi:hypothetical protein
MMGNALWHFMVRTGVMFGQWVSRKLSGAEPADPNDVMRDEIPEFISGRMRRSESASGWRRIRARWDG